MPDITTLAVGGKLSGARIPSVGRGDGILSVIMQSIIGDKKNTAGDGP